MSPHLVNGVLAIEDRRFFDHDGIDPRRIIMAAIANQRAGEIIQGGSTITQPLVRSMLLNRQKSYVRKARTSAAGHTSCPPGTRCHPRLDVFERTKRATKTPGQQTARPVTRFHHQVMRQP